MSNRQLVQVSNDREVMRGNENKKNLAIDAQRESGLFIEEEGHVQRRQWFAGHRQQEEIVEHKRQQLLVAFDLFNW